MTVRPFSIEIADQVIEVLRDRLRRTRFTVSTDVQWAAGFDPTYLRELVTYWLDDFDWSAQERELNVIPQFTAQREGKRLHFIHIRAENEERETLPLILTHGWPSSILEFLPLARMLTAPQSYGADPADAFDVVIPSIPGFLFSDLPLDGVVTPYTVADLWKWLMTDQLGYKRFGAYGGDLGSHVTDCLGARYPSQILGIYTHHPRLAPDLSNGPPLSAPEEAYLAGRMSGEANGKAYFAVQSTRPDTLAAGLIDSPAGLAAWIIEKYRDWGDCGGQVESRFDKELLLRIVTLYWVTGCIGPSFRSYYHGKYVLSPQPIRVPAGFTITSEDFGYPQEFADRTYADIRQWRIAPRGRHFFALEEPERLAVDLRDFFRPLRA